MKRIFLLAICTVCITMDLSAQKVLDSVYTYYFPDENDSIIANKQCYIWNSTGLKISVARYYWDSGLSRWGCACFYPGSEMYGWGRWDYTYDESGRRTETIGYCPSFLYDSWLKITKWDYEYDGDGNVVFSRFYHLIGKWIPVNGQEFSYDDKGKPLTLTGYVWDTLQKCWDTYYRYEYDYDDSGRKIHQLQFDWDHQLRDWVNHRKTEWQYDSHGNQVWFAEYDWTWEQDVYIWKENSRTEGVTDSLGRLVLEKTYSRQAFSNKVEYAYDAFGRLGSKTQYSNYGQGWIEGASLVNTYGSDGHLVFQVEKKSIVNFDVMERLRIETAFDQEGDISIQTFYKLNRIMTEYLLRNRDFFFYSRPTGVSEKILLPDINLYPNPTKGKIWISGLNGLVVFRIYSINGQLLRTFKRVNETVDISDLPSGSYFLEVYMDGGKRFEKQIIKE